MKGFFSKIDIIGETDNCQKCGLYKGCQSPRMSYTGQGEKRVLIIAEAPGKTEDEQNKQLVGQSGDLLRRHLSNLGLDLDRDFWKINAISCRPPENRKPKATEIKLCRPRVIETIKKLKPNFIWLMGNVALESFYMGDFEDTTITPWRKRCIPDQEFNAWIVPLYHPSFILRNKDEKLTATFSRDLEWAIGHISDTPVVVSEFERFIKPLYDINEIKHLLSHIDQSYIAFDYETSSLNPYKDNPQVFFASISNGEYSYAFQITDDIVSYWKRFLVNADVNKIAHNLKFEDKWSRVVFGVKPKGWHWDTMVSQHVLDGRKRTTGLKFQAYVRYGLKGYDKEIEKYKKDWTKVLNNPVLLEKALRYCGMDSLITFNLFLDQIKEFDENPYLQKGNDLFFKGNLALADVENNGIPVNAQYYLDENRHLELQINDLENQLMASNDARLFKSRFGKPIDLGSSKDLRSLFYDIKKIKPTKKTIKENDSVDHSVLSEMNTEFTNKLLELRKLSKIKDTYLAQFARETCDDSKLHPSFNLNMVVTYRSCVAKGTKILAIRDFIRYPDGVPIEEIKVGDFVYCFDDNLKPVIRKVLWSGKTGYKKIIRLHWKTRGGKGHVDVTPEHLIRHVSGNYVKAVDFLDKTKEINYGVVRSYKSSALSIRRIKDELFCTGNISKNNRGLLERGNQFGSFVPNNHKIMKVEILNEKVDVYDLEIEEYNNFIANEICVHNSSDRPNFQNIPVRDENAKVITRSGIIPSKGNQLLEVDYSALEVRVIGSVSKDKVLIDYIKSGADPHKDEAKEMFLFSNDEWDNLDKDIAKDIRFYAKNQKVFPFFYGSFYKSCAANIWPLIDKLKVKKHLRSKGIKDYFDFEEHLRVDENRFWSKFAGVKEWQNNTEAFYLENGYIEYVTGFRSDGYLTRNDLFNWPIQGPAFHCLLWSLTELNRELKKYKTKIIGQIHDSIVFDLYPPEEKLTINLCKGIMTRRIKRNMPWIIVPLEVEFEMTEIDQAWYYKKEVKPNGC